MKNAILKTGFIAALLVRFFTPSLVQFDANHRPVLKMPFHFSEGRVVVPVIKRATFLKSGFVIVDFKNGAFHFSPVRNHPDAASACSVCTFSETDGREACVNTSVSNIHFGINVRGPVINRSKLNDLRVKIIQRIKKDLGIRNKPSKKDCGNSQED